MIPNTSDAPRILLAEDEEPLRRMVARVLRTNGYQVVEAADGAGALSSWMQHSGSIEMLITDVIMPNIGGLELARTIRLSDPDIRVIYMSGYSEASITRTAQVPLEPDAAWISKPFSLRDLLDEVRSSLEAAPVMARPMRGAGCPAC